MLTMIGQALAQSAAAMIAFMFFRLPVSGAGAATSAMRNRQTVSRLRAGCNQA
jgi:hypothetical protein